MRVTVDRQQCESNGLCAEVAPDVLELDEDDTLRVLVEEPDPAQRPALELAVARCPRQALRLDA